MFWSSPRISLPVTLGYAVEGYPLREKTRKSSALMGSYNFY